MRGKRSLRNVHPIEDLFFKKRTIFSVDLDDYEPQYPDNDIYDVIRFEDGSLHPDEMRYLENHLGETTLERRLGRSNCTLFLACQSKTGDPVGFGWSAHTNDNAMWHDSFRVPPESGLVFNAFVTPSHRRRGVYRILQANRYNHLFESIGCQQVFTIVENRNSASMRANAEFGLQKKGMNYLVKFLSINVLSIIKSDTERQTHVVLLKGDV